MVCGFRNVGRYASGAQADHVLHSGSRRVFGIASFMQFAGHSDLGEQDALALGSASCEGRAKSSFSIYAGRPAGICLDVAESGRGVAMREAESGLDRLQVKFEWKRGHKLVLEGIPAFTRKDCGEFELRMLQHCEIHGLLVMETIEVDGGMSFHYSLAGTRMLSQCFRSEPWTLKEFLEGLCRLAEVMHECGLHVLDPDRLLLDEDLIFVGEDKSDLRLVYLPASFGQPPLRQGIESLIVKWMMRVTDLDGRVVQHLLRLTASPDFKPEGLRQAARQHLAHLSASVGSRQLAGVATPVLGQKENERPSGENPDESRREASQTSVEKPVWRWFAPPAGEPQSLSGLMGEEEESYPLRENRREGIGFQETGTDLKRQRVWLVCGAAAIIAIAWKIGYAGYGGQPGVIFSLGMTLAAAVGVVKFWRGGLFRHVRIADKAATAPQEKEGSLWNSSGFTNDDRQGHAVDPSPWSGEFPAHSSPISFTQSPLAPADALLTERLSERTQLLEQQAASSGAPAFFLEWVSSATSDRISLQEPALLIGRSREAAGHVDETQGVSRVHAEFFRTDNKWMVKDLGSRNGSRLNDRPMVPYEPYPLSPDDILHFAGSRYDFKCEIRPR
jgi:hypothetical protein